MSYIRTQQKKSTNFDMQ